MAKQAGSPASPGWLPGVGLPDQEWKLPFALAVGLHVVVLVVALVSPLLFDRGPVLPEIQYVNLFNAVESRSAPAVKPKRKVVKPQARKIKAMKREPLKKKVPVHHAPRIASKARPISERPFPSKTAKDLAKLREIKRMLARQQARQEEKLAKQQVKDAVADIRDLYREDNVSAPAPPAPVPPAAKPAAAEAPASTGAAATSAAGSGGGKGVVVEKVLRRYLAAVHDRIHQHWSLPDMQSWDKSLEAVIVIKVRKDGIVTDSFFQKHSNNFYFDQFVEKAVRAASPLPPFPPGLKEEQLEIGLRFRPGEIL